ncbi:hypothetical protein FHX42_004849 [Saccharopolyspora lacisalsi]|uniref:Uncharacterized protein n=1 Tax=Halosaccharopolyspora lacisalsi TaxID=1000566 RepID=A0A839E2F5_9PSEU|nr:hypothetical protein [Halosaccharopolyspora lacisalsi]MBA8827453.1 hypothetical protein [Halosaccharopolyspora lacisalsi]
MSHLVGTEEWAHHHREDHEDLVADAAEWKPLAPFHAVDSETGAALCDSDVGVEVVPEMVWDQVSFGRCMACLQVLGETAGPG